MYPSGVPMTRRDPLRRSYALILLGLLLGGQQAALALSRQIHQSTNLT